jgi:hypothetical protein
MKRKTGTVRMDLDLTEEQYANFVKVLDDAGCDAVTYFAWCCDQWDKRGEDLLPLPSVQAEEWRRFKEKNRKKTA